MSHSEANTTNVQSGRWWLIFSFTACFFWLSIEDTSMLIVALLAVSLALAMVYSRLSKSGETLTQLWQWLLIGFVTGAGAVLLTTGLMFFKTAWHSHQYPDFPLPMIIDMLTRLPSWGLAGALIGFAWHIFWHRKPQTN